MWPSLTKSPECLFPYFFHPNTTVTLSEAWRRVALLPRSKHSLQRSPCTPAPSCPQQKVVSVALLLQKVSPSLSQHSTHFFPPPPAPNCMPAVSCSFRLSAQDLTRCPCHVLPITVQLLSVSALLVMKGQTHAAVKALFCTFLPFCEKCKLVYSCAHYKG